LKQKVKYKEKKALFKACKVCETQFQYYTSTTKVCSVKCCIELANRKAVKAETKIINKETKEGRETLKTKTGYEKDLEKEINHIVRLLDKGHPCISSGRKKYIPNAGHMYSVGSNPSIRFNLLNIYNQSVGDNMYRGGNPLEYRERIMGTFGEDLLNEIDALKGRYPELKLTIPEIREAITKARKIVRELKKEVEGNDKPFTIEARILRRKEINKILNLYK
jgi:hypothetical protein